MIQWGQMPCFWAYSWISRTVVNGQLRQGRLRFSTISVSVFGPNPWPIPVDLRDSVMAELKPNKNTRYSSQHAFCKPAPKLPCPLPFLIRNKSHLVSKSLGASAVALLSDGELDTLALGQGDPGLLAANDKDVGLASGEGVVNGILKVDDGEATVVALTVSDDTNTTHVAAAGDHGNGTSVELDEVLDLASFKVDLDSVVDLDEGVRVTDAIQMHG